MPKSKPSPTWKALLDQSKVTEAKKAADTLWSEVGQDQAAVYGVLGEAVLAAGDADRGLQMIKEALKHDIDNRERLERAIALVSAQMEAKEKGNDCFKAKDYDAAIAAYGEGLEMKGGPLGPTLRCNRAACYMALKKYSEAIEDCTEALEQDPSMEKALRRRAQCYTATEEFQKAVNDHETLVELNGTREHRQQLKDAKLALKRSKNKDHYKTLGVPRNAGDADIKKAFKKAALKCHPDKVPAGEKEAAEKKFKEINEAYECLSDPQKRRKHDIGADMSDDEDDFSSFFRRPSRGGGRYGGGGFSGFGGFGGGGFDPFGSF